MNKHMQHVCTHCGYVAVTQRTRYELVKAYPTDQHFDWYVIDTVTQACVQQISGGHDMASNAVMRLNEQTANEEPTK